MNIEQAQAIILELEDKLSVMTGELEEFKKSNDELVKRNTDLQLHNQSLFLRVTQSKPQVENDDREVFSLSTFLDGIEI